MNFPTHTTPGHAKGYAEYVIAKTKDITLKPNNITHAEAAAIPMTALTTWQPVNNVRLKPISTTALLPMQRHGYTEECYFDFTFTPVYGEDGKVDGIFNAVIETTYRVINERRTAFLKISLCILPLPKRLMRWKSWPFNCLKPAPLIFPSHYCYIPQKTSS